MANGEEMNLSEGNGEAKASPDELSLVKGELTELKKVKEALTGALSAREARIAELEQIVSARDSEVTALKQTVAGLEAKLGSVNKSLSEAVSSYKAVVVQANPDIIEELISGSTIAEIDDSVAKAKTFISKVKKGLEMEAAKLRVPAGAPERSVPDLSALTPREKIQYAIGGKR